MMESVNASPVISWLTVDAVIADDPGDFTQSGHFYSHSHFIVDQSGIKGDTPISISYNQLHHFNNFNNGFYYHIYLEPVIL
jgi:hypothetical protein